MHFLYTRRASQGRPMCSMQHKICLVLVHFPISTAGAPPAFGLSIPLTCLPRPQRASAIGQVLAALRSALRFSVLETHEVW